MKLNFTIKGFLFLLIVVASGYTAFSQSFTTVTFTATCTDAATISWSGTGLAASGANDLVFVSSTGVVTYGTPTLNISAYTANTTFNSGTAWENDANAKCVYKGTGTSVNITGLTPGTTYYVLIIDAKGTTYNANNNSASGAALTTPPNPTGFSAVLNAAPAKADLSWTNATCSDAVMIVASTATITSTPSGDGTAYTANTAYGSGTTNASGISMGEYVVYKGTGTSTTTTALTDGLKYYFKIFTRKGTTWSAGVEVNLTLPPIAASAGSFTPSCVNAGSASWTNPSAVYNIVVFAKSGSSITAGSPTADVSTYTASTDLSSPGTAYENDASAHCVYNGSSNTVSLTNLTPGTNYYFLVYNANGTNYSSSLTFNNSTPSLANATGLSTTPGNAQVQLDWTAPTGCFDAVLVVASQSGAVTSLPTGDGTAYTANAAFGSGTTNTSGIAANEYVVYKGTGTTVTTTALTNCTAANFKIFTRKGTIWSSGASTSDTPVASTAVSSLSPLDNATSVATNTKLTITFSQNVTISATATAVTADKSIVITENGGAFQTLDRSSGSIAIVGNVVTITINTLNLNKSYDVVVGNKVFSGCGSDFAGITTTNWNFTSSTGATITAPTTTLCQNTYGPLGSIVIDETAINNIQGVASTSKTLVLKFDVSGFAFKAGTAGVSVATTGSDLTSGAPTSVSFSAATMSITFPSGNVMSSIDHISIDGLQVIADGSNATGHVVLDATSTLSIQGITAGTTTLATVNAGSSPPAAPTAATISSGTYNFCQNANISSVTASATGSSLKWYSDLALSSLVYSGSPANLSTNLGINSATPGTHQFYVTQTTTCESAALTFPLISVNANPGADAGTISAPQCSGSQVTLGGSPTVITPSKPSYTYTWSQLAGQSQSIKQVGSLTGLVGGSGYTNGTYNSVPATGGSGSSCLLNVSVTGGTVTSVSIQNGGTNYSVSDVLSVSAANIGGTGSGFTVNVATLIYSTADPNPIVKPVNTNTTNQNFQFQVLITDGNSCTATSTVSFNVYPQSNPVLTQPSSTQFTPTTDPQTLVVSSQFTNAKFHGVGVVQSNATTYQFAPKIAYDGIPANLPEQFTLYFDGNDANGCSIVDYPITTFTIAVNAFTYVQNQYCSNEVPYTLTPPTGSGPLNATATAIDLTPSGGAKTATDNFVSYWNTSGRFYQTNTIPQWLATNSYNQYDLVYYSGEVYRANLNVTYSGIALPAPNTDPANWTSGAFQTVNNGMVRNYYEGYYGGNTGNSTVRYNAGTYYMYTNPNYVNCPASTQGCSFLYPTTVVEFTNPFDARYYLQNYDPTYGYYTPPQTYGTITYPGSIVTYNGRVYKCLINNVGTYYAAYYPYPQVLPGTNASYWADITATGFDTGQVFYNPSTNKGGISYYSQYITVNQIPVVSFTGVGANQDICQAATPITLTSNLQTGNVTNAGHFQISFDKGTTWVKDAASGLASFPSVLNSASGPEPGIATLDPNNTWSKSTSVVNSQTWNGGSYSIGDNVVYNSVFYRSLTNSNSGHQPDISPSYWQADALTQLVRLYYDPGTVGSSSQACYGTSQVNFNLHKTPTVAINSIPMPHTLCNYDPVAKSLSSTPSTGVTFSGFGVTDTGSGTGKFDASSAFNQSVQAGGNSTVAQNIIIKATIQDAYGCTNFVTDNSYTVNPQVVASFSVSNITGGTRIFDNSTPAGQSIDFCNSDNPPASPAHITGVQTNSYYTLDYVGATPSNTVSYGSLGSPQNSFDFIPKTAFDDMVSNYGGNALNTIIFNLSFTAYDANNCITTLPPVALKVAPALQVDIAGINDGDVFCANEGIKTLTLSPYQSGVNLTINSSPKVLTSSQYGYDVASDAVANQQVTPVAITYTVTSGANCPNTKTKNISILAAPTRSFKVVPHCDQDLINYSGSDISINNSPPWSATYTWTFQDASTSQVVAQNTQYQWSGVANYAVGLQVDYPPVTVGAITKTCSSDSVKTQVVGPIPTVDFSYSNVCSGDATNFVSSQTNGVTDYNWDFGDGNVTGFGSGVSNISSTPSTSGTYKNPIHTFSPSTYSVILTGRTAAINGACTNTITRTVSILNSMTISPTSIYDMSALNGGDGNWIVEDKNGNSTWNFSSAAPSGGLPMSAWNNIPYNTSDQSYVNSPCFDMSAYTKPAINLDFFMDARVQQDGAVLQYSTDIVGGVQQWVTLGSVNSGAAWYGTQGISGKPGDPFNSNFYGWSRTSDTQWQNAKHSLDVIAALTPTQRQKVRFRIAFGSDQGSTNGASGFAFNNVKIVERNRISLLENFTNDNIPSAAANTTSFQNFLVGNTELVKMEYHTALPTSDATNQVNSADQNARAAFYGLTNSAVLLPRDYLDGYSQGNFSTNWVNNAFSIRSLVAAPLNISLATSPGTLNVTATANSSITTGNLRLYVALIETVVGSDQYVARKFYPNASGTVVTLPLNVADQVNLSINPWIIDSNLVTDINNVAVVAFVQDIDTKEVIQAEYLVNPTDKPGVITGVEDLSNKNVTVGPIPADQELSITLPAPAKEAVSIRMANQWGVYTEFGSFAEGEQTKTIKTGALTAGVYILQIGAKDSAVRTKVIVLH